MLKLVKQINPHSLYYQLHLLSRRIDLPCYPCFLLVKTRRTLIADVYTYKKRL